MGEFLNYSNITVTDYTILFLVAQLEVQVATGHSDEVVTDSGTAS